MTHASLQRIESALDGMETVLARAHGGGVDDEALLDFRRQCWELLLLVDDAECQAQLDLLIQHAKDLYSDRERERAEVLRGKIRALVAEFRIRVREFGRSSGRSYGKRWRDLRAA